MALAHGEQPRSVSEETKEALLPALFFFSFLLKVIFDRLADPLDAQPSHTIIHVLAGFEINVKAFWNRHQFTGLRITSVSGVTFSDFKNTKITKLNPALGDQRMNDRLKC